MKAIEKTKEEVKKPSPRNVFNENTEVFLDKVQVAAKKVADQRNKFAEKAAEDYTPKMLREDSDSEEKKNDRASIPAEMIKSTEQEIKQYIRDMNKFLDEGETVSQNGSDDEDTEDAEASIIQEALINNANANRS